MDAFWLESQNLIDRKSLKNQGQLSCTLWQGTPDKDGYGKQQVKWPDGSRSTEKAHRLSYMISKKLTRNEVPRMSPLDAVLDCSHLCHDKLCVNPQHLILEPRHVNMDRKRCAREGFCMQSHQPACLLCN